jgi:hypothetical protein
MDDEITSQMTILAWYDDTTDARSAAAGLVENGLGAVLDDSQPPRTGVAVLSSDAVRARELLGLEPVTVVGADGEEAEEAELRTMGRSWLVPVLVFAVALVVIPLVAFFVTFKLQGG